MMQTPSDPLDRAEALLRSGYKADAREILANYLGRNPDSAKGWWLMSYAVEDVDRQQECLERVLELYPGHRKAQKRISALRGEIPPAIGPLAKLQHGPIPLSTIALVLVFGCIGVVVVGFAGYLIFFSDQGPLPKQEGIAGVAAASSTVDQVDDQSSVTENQAVAPTVTQTSLPRATHTPLVSPTPTIDINATSTSIPENMIGSNVGEFPPNFTLINAITNAKVNLYDHFGQPIVLVFFNTLGAESDPEMPGLQAIYEKYQDQGLVVFGIGVGSSQSALRNYTGRFGGLTFPLFSDWEHTIARSYNVSGDVSGLPTTIFIRKNGRIWQVNYGAMKEEALDTVISSILRMP